MNGVDESCYEDIRATPLTTIIINFSTKMSGLTPLLSGVGESCYEDVRATPLNYLYYKFFYEDVRATPLNYHYYKFFYEDVRANAPYESGG